MHELIKLSTEAHGGLERWESLRKISVTVVLGGVVWKQRGQEAFTQMPTRVSIDTREQLTMFDPFLFSGQRGLFEPTRTAVEAVDGRVIEVLNNPRDSFTDRSAAQRWDATQLAYFAGYAMWMYLTMPFSLLRPDVDCKEVKPWQEEEEAWRALKVTFPKSYVTHSSEQTIYFDYRGLIQRQDYTVDISGGRHVAHYLYDYRQVDGLMFPTRRSVYLIDADGYPMKDLAVISADFSDFELLPATR